MISAATVFGLCAAVAVGLGLYGLIVTIEVAMTLTIAVTLGLLLAGAPERSA